jgi:hypothetical protein
MYNICLVFFDTAGWFTLFRALHLCYKLYIYFIFFSRPFHSIIYKYCLTKYEHIGTIIEKNLLFFIGVINHKQCCNIQGISDLLLFIPSCNYSKFCCHILTQLYENKNSRQNSFCERQSFVHCNRRLAIGSIRNYCFPT